jgi:hypothetical protein
LRRASWRKRFSFQCKHSRPIFQQQSQSRQQDFSVHQNRLVPSYQRYCRRSRPLGQTDSRRINAFAADGDFVFVAIANKAFRTCLTQRPATDITSECFSKASTAKFAPVQPSCGLTKTHRAITSATEPVSGFEGAQS